MQLRRNQTAAMGLYDHEDEIRSTARFVRRSYVLACADRRQCCLKQGCVQGRRIRFCFRFKTRFVDEYAECELVAVRSAYLRGAADWCGGRI